MTWFIFFVALTIADGKVDYELGINQERTFASEQACDDWLSDDANYDKELDMVSAVYPGEIVFGCAHENELPDYLLPGTGI
jgi:hypothetical protein